MGIYKITNDLNGMSYIGQSVHCGKRFDEHCKGDQYIDRVMQTEGIDNFSFKILQKVHKSELSIWEDYYITKYNTMYPNGYNKKWNCSEKTRNMFINNIDNSVEEASKQENTSSPYTREDLLLYLANIMQEQDYNEDRILNQKQLKAFYEMQKKEALHRTKISNAYDKTKLIKVTDATKRRAESIEDLINRYNNGESTWIIKGWEDLGYVDEENFNLVIKDNIQYFMDTMGYIPDFGVPTQIKRSFPNQVSFNKEGIIYYILSQTDPIFNIYRNLFKIGYFNPEKVYVLDEKNNRFNVNEKYVWKKHGYLRLIITS